MPNSVTPNMPLNTAVPSVRRISAPAPVGDHQRHDAEDEGERGHQDRPQPQPARLQRGLAPRQARLALLLGELDDQDGVLAGQADQHHEADLREDVDVAVGDQPTPTSELSRHIGTTRMTASGSDQLSYWAASTRNTQHHRQGEDQIIAVLPACDLRGR